MKNIKKLFTYVVVGALISALFISCKNDDKTGGGSNLDIPIPTATGEPATVANAEFSGTLRNVSLTGNGWTQEQMDEMVNANQFSLSIQDNKVGCSYIDSQLLCPDSSKPNVVESSMVAEEILEESGGKSVFTAYIKITLDDTNNPTTATVEYYFKLYSSEYSGTEYSDTVVVKYEGTLTKFTSSQS